MPNVLNRVVTEPSKVWVSDITYSCQRGFLYLTTVLDLYDRKIIGWSLSSGMSVEETSLAAWRMAIKTEASKGLIFHSDRGVQYASKKLQTWLILIKSLPEVW
jgi:transposase InsO family protein